MADNIDITAGSGTTVAADDIGGGVYAQRVKVIWGVDGTGTDASASNPLPVVQTGTHNIGTVTTVSTVTAVTAISNALPAGTNAIGKLAANSGVDIGDVDVTTVGTITPGTAATNLGKAEDAAHTSGDVGVMALAVQKAVPVDLGADGDYGPHQISQGGTWVRHVGDQYETVAASQTAQVIGASGATGDYIREVLVVPATVSPGNVLLLDNATSITVFTGGTNSVSNLVPFTISLGLKSVSGAWKLTTGANVSAIGIGQFT